MILLALGLFNATDNWPRVYCHLLEGNIRSETDRKNCIGKNKHLGFKREFLIIITCDKKSDVYHVNFLE